MNWSKMLQEIVLYFEVANLRREPKRKMKMLTNGLRCRKRVGCTFAETPNAVMLMCCFAPRPWAVRRIEVDKRVS